MDNAAASETAQNGESFLQMSDEDFLKVNAPPASAGAAADTKEEDAANASDKEEKGEEDDKADGNADAGKKDAGEEEDGKDAGKAAADDASGDDADADASNADADDAGKSKDAKTDPGKDKSKADDKAADKTADKPADKSGDKGDGKDPSGSKAKPDGAKDQEKTDAKATDAKPIDYEGFFKQVMAPFKANGKMFELKSPEEVIRLMQMGAGFGKKIQDLQPSLKTIRMLEKNDLLDEGKLSFLIEINNKNPEAIKKLIKESGIDPLDLNMEDNASYIPKNHSVTDEEMAFQNALSDIQGHEGGRETLRTINETWDQQSKALLWKEPNLLGVIQSHRDEGIYDKIVAEIDRQKTFGQIPHSMPFLQAYKVAGDVLFPSDAQAPTIQNQTGQDQQSQVIATRAAAPKATVQNGDKAAAASPTKTTPRKAATVVNPLEMADDDFMKNFKGRF